MEPIDWAAMATQGESRGYAMIAGLLDAGQCAAVAALWNERERFRSEVIMARHGYGSGVYRYFGYPLPDPIRDLRTWFYPPLVQVANRWAEALGRNVRYPPDHMEFLARCRGSGQSRPTPLLLRYESGDWNALHQDVHGENVFPLQVAVLLSDPVRDFTGGEFVLAEQRPRMQSRAEVVPLQRGDAVVFPVRERPAKGSRGWHRRVVRHGVSRVRSGLRMTLGIVFHDAH